MINKINWIWTSTRKEWFYRRADGDEVVRFSKNSLTPINKTKKINKIIHVFWQISIKWTILNEAKLLPTGSTLSQLLYFPVKSSVMTWPQTDVNLKKAGSPWNLPRYSWTEHAPFEPFRVVMLPLERILAKEAASDGFSATMKTVFMIACRPQNL